MEDHTAAGECGLGLRQLIIGHFPDLDAFGPKPGDGVGKSGVGENQVVQEEDIGGIRLPRIDLDDVHIERFTIHPLGVHQHPIRRRQTACTLEVQATSHLQRFDGVAMRGKVGAQLSDALGIGTARLADQEMPSDLQDISTIKGSRGINADHGTECPDRLFDDRELGPSADCSGSGENGEFRHDHQGVLDEDTIRTFGVGRQFNELAAGGRKGLNVCRVLGSGFLKVDRDPIEVGQFARFNRIRDVTNEGGLHPRQCSSAVTMTPMNIDFRLDGKTAVVAGSTQGIGRSIAEAFAAAGATVHLMGRNQDGLDQVLESLDRGSGQSHQSICVDFSDWKAVEAICDQQAGSIGPVHILVNNTGGPPAGFAVDATPDQFVTYIQQHLACFQAMVRAFAPRMRAEGYGRILNIISTSVITPIRGLGISNAVRGAVANWGRTLAVELGGFGITVNNILPGFTDTARLNAIFEGKASRGGTTVEAVRTQAIGGIPAGRIGSPEEVAAAAQFLASPAGSYCNGLNMPVDGGRVCQA